MQLDDQLAAMEGEKQRNDRRQNNEREQARSRPLEINARRHRSSVVQQDIGSVPRLKPIPRISELKIN
jgi:hypothetical protein